MNTMHSMRNSNAVTTNRLTRTESTIKLRRRWDVHTSRRKGLQESVDALDKVVFCRPPT